MRSMLAVLLLLMVSWAQDGWTDVKVRVTRVAASTSTGNQDITISGFSTPKAWLLFMSSAIADGTAANHALWATGAGDCTRHWVVHNEDRDTGAASDANHRATTTQGIQLYQTDGTTIDGEGTISCITDGIRINWTTALSAAYFLHVVLFTGSDLSARADTVASSATIGNTVDVTAPNFPVRDVFVSSARTATFANANVAQAQVVLGISNSNATGSVTSFAFDNVTAALTSGVHSAWVSCAASGDFPAEAISLGTFDSQGFTVTTQEVASSITYGYLALGYNSVVRSWNGQTNFPAGTGDNAYTGPGWRPQFVLSFASGVATANVTSDGTELFEADDDAGLIGVSLMDSTNQYSMAIRSDDNNAAADTASLSDNQAFNVLSATGAARLVGTLVGFTATGWTINYTTTSSSAGWSWAIEESPTGFQGIPLWFGR